MTAPSMRAQAGATVSQLFEQDPRLAVVLAEISLEHFRRAFECDPARAVNVGIMEQTMIGVAAGFALEGFLPVAHTITPFMAERALEQVKDDLGNQELGAILIGTGGSFDYGAEGTTHHSPGDVQALTTVPGLRVLVPGHPAEVDQHVRAAHADRGLTYIRTEVMQNSRGRHLSESGVMVERRGSRATVIAVGPMLDPTLAAVEGMDVTVLYLTTVAPIDTGALAEAAADAPDVITVEPFHQGTLAAGITATFSHRPARFHSLGFPRRVVREYGEPADHYADAGLDAAGIRRRVVAILPAAGVTPNPQS